MFLSVPEEDPLPGYMTDGSSRASFESVCAYLDRQCDETEPGDGSAIWKGVDLNGVALSELPALLGTDNEMYDGPFLKFCKKAVKKGKYKRFGNEDNVLNLRLKIVAGQGEYDSLTILLQHEYIGYDVSLENQSVVLRRTGQDPEILTGSRAQEVLDDIEYVAMRLIEYSYQSHASSRIETCDSLAQSATSEVSASRQKRSLAKRALKLLLT